MKQKIQGIYQKIESFRQSYENGNMDDAMNLAMEIDNVIYKEKNDVLELYDVAEKRAKIFSLDDLYMAERGFN
ncbi:MAG: hypothetical protein ACOC3Z_02775 [Nanoarchaeota archaeon]